MNSRRILVFTVAALLGSVVPAAADVIIFDNGDSFINSLPSDYSFPNQFADDFVLQPGASTITGIRWYGIYLDDRATTDDFIIRIFEDNGGKPNATALHVFSGVT